MANLAPEFIENGGHAYTFSQQYRYHLPRVVVRTIKRLDKCTTIFHAFPPFFVGFVNARMHAATQA